MNRRSISPPGHSSRFPRRSGITFTTASDSRGPHRFVGTGRGRVPPVGGARSESGEVGHFRGSYQPDNNSPEDEWRRHRTQPACEGCGDFIHPLPPTLLTLYERSYKPFQFHLPEGSVVSVRGREVVLVGSLSSTDNLRPPVDVRGITSPPVQMVVGGSVILGCDGFAVVPGVMTIKCPSGCLVIVPQDGSVTLQSSLTDIEASSDMDLTIHDVAG